MMLLLQDIEGIQSFRNLLQTGRIVFHVFRKAVDVASYIAYLDDDTLQTFTITVYRREDLSYLLNCLAGTPQRIDSSYPTLIVASVEQSIDASQRNLDVLSM